MKNLFLIFLLIVVTFWAIHLLDYKEPYVFDQIQSIDVSKEKCDIQLMTTKEIKSSDKWFYEYEIKEDALYITTYKVVNPLSKNKGITLEIHINKGYEDFNEIYVNGDEEARNIWTKEAES